MFVRIIYYNASLLNYVNDFSVCPSDAQMNTLKRQNKSSSCSLQIKHQTTSWIFSIKLYLIRKFWLTLKSFQVNKKFVKCAPFFKWSLAQPELNSFNVNKVQLPTTESKESVDITNVVNTFYWQIEWRMNCRFVTDRIIIFREVKDDED